MNIQNKIWWLLPSGSLLVGIATAILLRTAGGFGWSFSLKEALLFASLLLVSTCTIRLIINAYPTKVGIFVYALATGIVLGGLSSWLHGFLSPLLLSGKEEFRYGPLIDAFVSHRLMLYLCLLLLVSITLALYRRMDEIEKRYALQQDASALLKEAELFKLHQQLQPHFLYNSLNAISSLIIISPDKAGEMISRLSDFLRASVRQGRSELVPLSEELDYLRNYLWIEAVRFGDRLQIEWSGEETAADAKLPPFLLQPLMENAIRYGLYGRTGDVTIGVHIALRERVLYIRISNPFDASMKASGGTGFGLEGIRRRLYLTYARQDLLRTNAIDGHFNITLHIPQ
jgi:sensor histidine kinase YesM